MNVSAPRACLVLTEGSLVLLGSRRGHGIPLNWSYRPSCTYVCMLRLEPRSYRRALFAIDLGNISPASYFMGIFLDELFIFNI